MHAHTTGTQMHRLNPHSRLKSSLPFRVNLLIHFQSRATDNLAKSRWRRLNLQPKSWSGARISPRTYQSFCQAPQSAPSLGFKFGTLGQSHSGCGTRSDIRGLESTDPNGATSLVQSVGRIFKKRFQVKRIEFQTVTGREKKGRFSLGVGVTVPNRIHVI